MTQFAFHNEIAVVYVNAIREFFATNALASEYRYSDDAAQSKVHIAQEYAANPLQRPSIMVDAEYVSEAEVFFGDTGSDIIVDGSWEGQHYEGTELFNVKMSAEHIHRINVKAMSSLLMMALRTTIFRRVPETSNNNIRPQRGIRATGAGGRPINDSDVMFFAAITQQAKAAWFEDRTYDEHALTYLNTMELKTFQDKITVGTRTAQSS